jgi:hypothetical protein
VPFRCGLQTNADLAHMTNTLYSLAGTTSCEKTFENRSIPRPLLVVHSGNTTTGLSALFLISSRLTKSDPAARAPYGGAWPVRRIADSRETRLNPRIGTIALAALFRDDIFADPVPARLPGGRTEGRESARGSVIGSKKIGLNLKGRYENHA